VIALGNAPQYGNNAFICPGASMQDSLLHGTIIHPFPSVLAPLLTGSMFAKKLGLMPYVETFITNELELRVSEEQYFHADGEALGKSDVVRISVGSEKLLVYSMSEKL
jgi:diacylglycerol kinase family enzyme